MYYPYLRGRQNEMLCLRTLLEKEKLSEKIVPVIEPVKFNATFFSTIKKFIEQDRDIIIIKNPGVGKFLSEYREMKESIVGDSLAEEKRQKKKEELELYKQLLGNSHIKPAYVMNDQLMKKISAGEKDISQSIVINREENDYSYYSEFADMLCAQMTFIPPTMDFLDEISGDAVLLRDVYNKRKRNVDYLERIDEMFSRYHLVYVKYGYCGFSDYSIVGGNYEDSGFAPLAVAIHIVYFNEKKQLMIHHFVSDSNENMYDPARKFEEAMEKLVNWERIGDVKKTLGLQGLIDYYNAGKFPGLGVVKRYSIMHHLELIGEYLGENA